MKAYYDMCMENPTARVENCENKPKNKWRPRPLPLNTGGYWVAMISLLEHNITTVFIVELEKLASRKLKLSAKKTMTIAERLYTQGLISYPRTETNKFPPEINLSPLVDTQRADGRWGGFAGR